MKYCQTEIEVAVRDSSLKSQEVDSSIDVVFTPQAGYLLEERRKRKYKLKGYARLVKESMQKREKVLKDIERLSSIDENTVVSLPSMKTPFPFTPQSGVEGVSLVKTSLDLKTQNMTFSDQVATQRYDVKSEMDATRMLQDTNDATLENFFSRPVKISEQEWATNTPIAYEISPWELFFENPRVNARISNFSLLRCKLHLKIVINGNGFQYGRAVAAYNPLDIYDDFATHEAGAFGDLVHTTQLPHVYLDPTTSAGGEMILPFFYHKNYLSIVDGDWQEMGQLYVRSINELKHANGATDSVTISIFAWAEDVSMSVLTSQDAFTAQSGEDEVDEANKTGVISGPASVVAKYARVASGISTIAPYAMATAKAADVIGGMAKMFGYCAPPVTKAPDPYKPYNTSTMAVTNVPQNVNKLTMDEKQELSIDPRIAGLSGDDPLNIRDIASREAIITKFQWAVGTAPETLLWNSRVSPVTWNHSTQDGNLAYLFPPCAIAALPFEYWTGTMKFRFQIVCSSFHKGRLRFVWDPHHVDANEYNVNYMRVVDISKEQDFTMEIGNGQEFTLLDHASPGTDFQNEVYSVGKYTSDGPGNGVLSVYVLNELTVPNSTVNNDIEINVFVSMGDDFEVFVPSSKDITHFVFEPQSGGVGGGAGRFAPQSGEWAADDIVPESQGTKEPSAPLQTMAMDLGPTEQDLSDVSKVFTGESIASFRSLLKRWAFHSTNTLQESRGATMAIRCMQPYLRGAVDDAVNQTAALEPYNYCNTTLFHWIVYCFSGRRGSMRWRMLPRRLTNNDEDIIIYAQRNPLGIGLEYVDIKTPLGVYPSQSVGAARSTQSGLTNLADSLLASTALDGSSYTNSSVNTAIEIEVPYYSRFRFSPGKSGTYTGLELFDPSFRYHVTASSVRVANVDEWYATGEDFQVYFWTGLPRMFYEATTPAAA